MPGTRRKLIWLTPVWLLLAMLAACGTRPADENTQSPAASQSAPLDVGIALPLELRVTALGEVQRGQVIPVEVKFTSYVAEAEVKVMVDLPPEMSLEGGDSSWQGKLRNGESGSFQFGVRVLGAKPGFVMARAEVIQPQKRSFTQAASAYLDPERQIQKSVEIKGLKGYEGASELQIHKPSKKDSK